MQEIWISVIGWEESYEVSDLGRVRSVDRTITVLGPCGRIADRFFRGRILKRGLSKWGYLQVNFTGPARKRETRYVHELVATHFLGPRPPGMEVCHRAPGKINCAKTNLRWGTRSSNALDRHEHGTMNLAFGEDHYYHKLTEKDVHWIRRCRGLITQRGMAEMLGVTHGTVGSVLRGLSWKQVA